MAPLVVPDTYMCRLRYKASGLIGAGMNVFGIQTDGTVLTSAIASRIGGYIQTAWNTNAVHVSQNWGPNDVTIIDLASISNPEFNESLTGAGGGAGDELPRQCCVLTTFYTNLRGKSFRGRQYMPGIIEGQQNNGQITGALQTDWSGFWAAIQSSLQADTVPLDLAVISRKRSESNPVTSIIVHTKVRTQRRRGNRS